MPIQQTNGNAAYDSYGGGAAAVPNYVEDVFSAYTYTGDSSASRVITNGVDLSTYGGLVWTKTRQDVNGFGTPDHKLTDTARGVTKGLKSNTTNAQTNDINGVMGFGATGYTLGSDSFYNGNSNTFVSWTFRKQPKFFDVVTYTGNGSSITVNHSLASTPGCIIVKKTNASGTASDWVVWHTSVPANCGFLNLTSSFGSAQRFSSVTSTNFTINVGTADVNENASTYVAYVFASNAGGFGLTGTDNVITCGSFTTDGSGNATVNLGWEPQYLIRKGSSNTNGWDLFDQMRGFPATPAAALLQANTSAAESSSPQVNPTATGFQITSSAISQTYIYIAIRRGPMRVPTDGTKVYNAIARTGTGVDVYLNAGFPVDLVINKERNGIIGSDGCLWEDRLRGALLELESATTDQEVTRNASIAAFDNTGATLGGSGTWNYGSGSTYVDWFFRRAPGFFDEVCYTGTGANATISHNLGIAPEFMIVKERSAANDWWVYAQSTGNTKYLVLNSTATPVTDSTAWNNTTPTSSVFSVGTGGNVNASTQTYVAYLFASCPGVSKVGSYTGNGTTQTINCGFTGGARFVLIKRTDSTGDWYTYDTARGMTTVTDPYLQLNSTAAETATLGSVTTVATGFAVNAAILAAINTNAASYIFLAIA